MKAYKSILVTGVSGVGKSTVCSRLARLGFRVFDIEAIPGVFTAVDEKSGAPIKDGEVIPIERHSWVCDTGQLRHLVSAHRDEVVFFCGTGSNIVETFPLFDLVLLLKVSSATLRERLSNRPPPNFATTPSSIDWVISWKQTWEERALSQGAVAINAEGGPTEVAHRVAIVSGHPKRVVDLSRGQRRLLGDFWAEEIIGGGVISPRNLQEMTNEGLRKWLFTTILDGVGLVAKKWRLGDSDGERGVSVPRRIKIISRRFERYYKSVGYSSAKWDSWPKLMGKTERFNCVGASLLGLYLLGVPETPALFGNPPGHALIIVPVGGDKYWLVDFLNGDYFPFTGVARRMAGVCILEILDNASYYKFIPVFPPEVISGSVLMNWLLWVAESGAESRYHGVASLARPAIYPEFDKVRALHLMTTEAIVIKYVRLLRKRLLPYINSLSPEEKSALLDDLRANKISVAQIVSGGSGDGRQFSEPLASVVATITDTFADDKEPVPPEVRREAVRRVATLAGLNNT